MHIELQLSVNKTFNILCWHSFDGVASGGVEGDTPPLSSRGKLPSCPARFICLTEVNHGFVRSETGWGTSR